MTEARLLAETVPPLLRVRDLNVLYGTAKGTIRSVDGVSFDVARGEVVALVGESGSGKSVTVRSTIGLELHEKSATITGSVDFGGQQLLTMEHSALRSIWRNRIGMVFQDPLTSFNPVLKIGDQMIEVIRGRGGISRRAALLRAEELLAEVQIPSPRQRLRLYPHELSGGMRQRVAIAMAIANEPELLVADEPTTALDVTVQRQLLDLLMDLVQRHKMSLLLVTHNLALVSGYADRGLVMYGGRLVEEFDATSALTSAAHPYTRGLIQSIPTLGTDRRAPLTPIPGGAPDMRASQQGCAFASRCPLVEQLCRTTKPALERGPLGAIACHVVSRGSDRSKAGGLS